MKQKSKSYKLPVKRDVFLSILFCCIFAAFSLCLSPLGLHTGHTADVTLSWTASTGDVAGYKVYTGTSSGTYNGTTYDAGKFTSIGVSGLQTGTTYYFAAKAYNTSGLLSGFSNQVSYTVPSATSTGTSTTPTGTTTTATYYLTPYVMEGKSYGSVSPSTRVYVPAGSSFTFKITPFTGHKISGVWVDGTTYVGTPTSYTFNNITRKHFLVIKFQ